MDTWRFPKTGVSRVTGIVNHDIYGRALTGNGVHVTDEASLRDAIESATDGQTILVDANITLTSAWPDNGVSIAKTVTILGNAGDGNKANIKIDGSSSARRRFINTASGANVVLDHLIITNGDQINRNGLIQQYSPVAFPEFTFEVAIITPPLPLSLRLIHLV